MTPVPRKFPHLEGLMVQIDMAETRFELKTAKTYDETVIAAAAAEFNKVLEEAARALLEDLGSSPDAETYLEKWKPATAVDTWFGPKPLEFLRHVLTTGVVHRDFLPDESTIR